MDTEKAEGATENLEGRAPAVPELSGTSQGQPASTGTADADALAEKVWERLSPKIQESMEQASRHFQGTVDKKIAPYERIAQALKKHNGDIEAAKQDVETQEAVEYWRQTKAGNVASPASSPAAETEAERRRMEAVAAEVLSDADIDFEDPRYKAFIAEVKVSGSKDFELRLRREKDKWLKQATVGGGAALPSAGHSARTEEDDPTKLYNAEIALVKAGKHSTIRPGDVRGIWALQQDYQKRGAKVGSDTPTPTPAQRTAKK